MSERDRLFAMLAAKRGLAAAQGIPRRDPARVVPLLPGQRQLWFLDRVGATDGVYTMSQVWRLSGAVSVTAIQHALDVLLARHEGLRTSFTEVDGEPVQRIAECCVAPLSVMDGGMAELEAESRRPFDLTTPPLLRAVLVRISDGEHLFALCVHHIVCDGPSLSILVDEFSSLLAGAQPAARATSACDFAVWQADQAADLTVHARYWEERLAGVPTLLELPTDRPRPPVQSYRGASVPVSIKDGEAVSAFCLREGLTAFPLLLAAFSIVLGKLARADDVVVGVPMRDDSKLSNCVGMLANTVAMRTELSGDPTVRAVLDRARQDAVDALEHQGYPWELVARAVAPQPDLSHNPVFQAMFVLNPPGHSVSVPGLAAEPVEPESATARFDLTLALAQEGSRFEGHLDYATDLFDAGTVARIAEYFTRAVAAITADPDQRVGDVDLLTDHEWSLIRSGGHPAAPAPFAARCVTELIARQARRTPDAPAVLDGDDVLSYAELTERANALAWRLRECGVGPESLVAMAAPAGPAAVVALVGIHAAGGAYLPLDPAHPADRLAALLADAGVTVLVTDRADRVAFDGTVLVVGVERRDAPPPTELGPDNLAYVIYTSGSTGAPKGVAVQHGTVANLARAFVDVHGFGPGERVLMIPPLTFDASVGDVFPALISGASLVACPDPAALSGADVLRWCAEQNLTMVDTAAPLWRKWVDDLAVTGVPGPSPLRAMMVGGDTVAVSAVREWAAMTGAAMFNHYGPTEATVCATTYRTDDGDLTATRLPIGRPLPHVRAYVVDERLRPVPVGVPGELCLGGDALARGYLGRGDLTAERFAPDPFGEPGSRLYRTGDLVRWGPDQELEFLGRVDRQVKVRGHRIEPAEIEAVCRRHPAVTDALVVARTDESTGDRRLVGYLVPAGDEPDPGELRAFLRAALPEYLVPGEFVVVPEFPLTGNGKLDHAALPAPARTASAYVEPSTDTGKALAAEWGRLLDRDRVGEHDNFFELGGHSLLAARMITRVRVALGVDLPLRAVFESATLGALAAAIDEHTAAPTIDLWAEATLPEDARPVGPSPEEIARAVESAADPRAVLLTGATGFLGSHLLADALRHTDAQLFCLVRARDEADAMARIERTLRGYQRWRPEFAHRIVAVPGDLAAPRLGLSPRRFDALAAEIDLIHHCGGQVSFAQPYADLRAANVSGTVEVLRLACLHRLTPVQFVSTLGVYPLHLPGVVTEDTAPDQPEHLDRGYEQTKWVADTLVRAARAAGLPVSVHRPARVTGDSRTGIGPVEDLFGRELRTVAMLGVLPDVDDEEDMAPVDHVAAAIGWLSRRPSSYGADFHFHNGRTIRSTVVADTLRDFGYPVRALPYDQWRAELLTRAADSGDPSLVAIAAVAGPTPDRRNRLFDCTATERRLAEAGLRCPPADPDLLRRYLDHYVRAGHLPAPDLVPGGGRA
ncbi:non-ribosomal peptide synthetase [Actinokineospora xionganensis]|uniref:Amino acid adenylation domain-containing protein n=1 Tax=Actinokineospora xionganensis TaxID=2684470 RepID=A0ABR7L5Z3_9PSEU|nr:non-ribosomal peptide synthetase [Actinokineospora xionganensis]MBC6448100.1 amino acid adenylation domain-containing protein [Actinokineospora xionganensis]